MEKNFICLANSYKNGGRCLAGIEVIRDSSGNCSIVKDSRKLPVWIRPVMDDDTQGIPNSLVSNINLLDIVKVEVIRSTPNGSHVENVKFKSLSKVGNCKKSTENLDLLCDNYHTLVFGNRGKAVPSENFEQIGYSLMLIKPDDVYIETDTDDYEHEIFRIRFDYQNNKYTLKLTDPIYINKLQQRQNLRGQRYDDLYLSLSLGVNYNGWHFKLVAGVIDIDN